MDMIKYYALLGKVNEEITKRSLTYRDLGTMIEIDHTVLYRVLTGKRKRPNTEVVIKAIKFLKRDDLLFELLSLM